MSARMIEPVDAGAAVTLQPARITVDPARQERQELLRREREIAAKYTGGSMWGYSISALGGFAVWVALFPLAMFELVPLWAAFIVATVLATCGYIVSHEAMHSNIARKGEKLRWLNELVGQVSTIPLIFPFSMARMMHLQHHYHTNDPVRDPDYPDGADNAWKAVIKTWLNRQPGADGSIHHYKRVLASIDTPAARRAERETAYLQLFAMAFFFAMAWSGYGLVAAAVWWLPRHIGLSYIRFWLSWAPHHPRSGHDRYSNTRVFKSRLGHVMSMCMETHIVHHLYPSIPNHKTRRAYYEMRDILAARGVDVSPL